MTATKPEAQRNTVVVFGPRGCGKTFNANALAAHFGLHIVVDDWDPHMHRLTPGALHLSNQQFTGMGKAALCIDFQDVKFSRNAIRPGLIRQRPVPRIPTP